MSHEFLPRDLCASRASTSEPHLTLGIEEEFHLVDLVTRRLTDRAADVLKRLATSAGTYVAELQQSVVESNTRVTSSLTELRDDLVSLRGELIHTAESLGIGVAAAGTMPLTAPLQITELPRYQRMLADYQLLAREQLICSMQVHVGMPDRDLAARLLGRVNPWLPPLLALSASSPFSCTGDDTGYASVRSLIWSRWPSAGPAGAFESAVEYNACVQNLIASGVISDAGMIYFDVRPSAHVPTLELRICDACPDVNTVVLIAGLFRAIVAREIARDAEGIAPPIILPALQRAAMWRAARSGLECELVDLSGPRSVPAGVLLRGIALELRPELEMHGDWETVQTLCNAAIERGSSAARQREALRLGGIAAVVDSILAETRGEAREEAAPSLAMPMLSGYRSPAYDECLFADRRTRGTHAAILPVLCGLGPLALRGRHEEMKCQQVAEGIVFRPTGKDIAVPLPIDVVPRVISGEEWSRIQGGTEQRARALDAFIQDIYGERCSVRDGVIPEWIVQSSPGYRPSEGTAAHPGSRRAHVCGFDIIRDEEGRWRVLEDNVRVPSGVGYAIQYRRLMYKVFPELTSSMNLLDPEVALSLLAQMLRDSAPPRASGASPYIVLITSGASDSAYFEHWMLAKAIGISLVEPAELAVADGILWHQTPSGSHRVDIAYLRIDEPLRHLTGADGAILGPQLVAAVRAGTLTLVNALGNGVADDKAVYAYVPRFIEYYLGEHPLLEQVPTYHCAVPEQCAEVLDRLQELVIKPVDGYGGHGVLIGPHATQDELENARRLIMAQPSRWIAQNTLTLSTHPTLCAGVLRPQHVDLRVFVYHGAQAIVVPAALTRVAPPGSLVVNSSRGGGAKDTWLLQ
jgi:glutamate---cysteine ligase / carboxylate-amine ligase